MACDRSVDCGQLQRGGGAHLRQRDRPACRGDRGRGSRPAFRKAVPVRRCTDQRHPQACLRRCDRGRRSRARAIRPARRRDARRQRLEQEPGAHAGDFQAQSDCSGGHRRAGDARQQRRGQLAGRKRRRQIFQPEPAAHGQARGGRLDPRRAARPAQGLVKQI